jgi:hypothetical protein
MRDPLDEQQRKADYLKEQQRKFEDYVESYRKETNSVFRELAKQLILVATVFLSISALVLANKDLFNKINLYEKHIISFIWILLASSLIFGIIQLVVDYFFLKKWTRAKFEVVKGIVFKEINETNIGEKSIEKQNNISSESSTIFIWLQIITLSLAVILFIGMIIKLLFL